MDSYNEDATLIVNAAFKDEDHAPVTPTSATYRLEDTTNKAVIVPTTAITIGSGVTDVDIELTPAQMLVRNPARQAEGRRLLVFYTYGSGRKGNGAYNFDVTRVD